MSKPADNTATDATPGKVDEERPPSGDWNKHIDATVAHHLSLCFEAIQKIEDEEPDPRKRMDRHRVSLLILGKYAHWMLNSAFAVFGDDPEAKKYYQEELERFHK